MAARRKRIRRRRRGRTATKRASTASRGTTRREKVISLADLTIERTELSRGRVRFQAFVGKTRVGYISIWRGGDAESGWEGQRKTASRDAIISMVHVASRYRRRGIGTRLYLHAAAYVRRQWGGHLYSMAGRTGRSKLADQTWRSLIARGLGEHHEPGLDRIK